MNVIAIDEVVRHELALCLLQLLLESFFDSVEIEALSFHAASNTID